MRTIVSLQWVADQLNQQDTVILDCRFSLGQSNSGLDAYIAGHIPGAYYFDLEQDLSSPKREHGGRHPLPDTNELAAKFAAAGIAKGKMVILYDDQGGTMAARAWWLLKYLGFEGEIHVMDEGFAKWKESGRPTTTVVPEPQKGSFPVRLRESMLVTMEEVRSKIGSPDVILVDSREEPRYRGISEHIDKAAGHIPGARNMFWKANLNAEGHWKSLKEQQARFEKLQDAKEIIVYCGSGVTACPNVLALAEAGFSNVRMYAGSWSDWISYEGNPIATGEE